MVSDYTPPPVTQATLKGAPYVTVSPVGLAQGYPKNNNANFGPDTPGTTTSGIQEAISNLPQVPNPISGRNVPCGKIVIIGHGTFSITTPIYVYTDWYVDLEGFLPASVNDQQQYNIRGLAVTISSSSPAGCFITRSLNIGSATPVVTGGYLRMARINFVSTVLINAADTAGGISNYVVGQFSALTTGYPDQPSTVELEDVTFYDASDTTGAGTGNAAFLLNCNGVETLISLTRVCAQGGVSRTNLFAIYGTTHCIIDTLDIQCNYAPPSSTSNAVCYLGLGGRSRIGSIHLFGTSGNSNILFTYPPRTDSTRIGSLYVELNQPASGTVAVELYQSLYIENYHAATWNPFGGAGPLATVTLNGNAWLHFGPQAVADGEVAGSMQMGKFQQGFVTIPTNPPVSGTTYQNALPVEVDVYIPITYNPTASSPAQASGYISPVTPITASAVETNNVPAGLTSEAGLIRTMKLTVPPGWYWAVQVSNATIGTAVPVGK